MELNEIIRKKNLFNSQTFVNHMYIKSVSTKLLLLLLKPKAYNTCNFEFHFSMPGFPKKILIPLRTSYLNVQYYAAKQL